jgi:hypothetical protein
LVTAPATSAFKAETVLRDKSLKAALQRTVRQLVSQGISDLAN